MAESWHDRFLSELRSDGWAEDDISKLMPRVDAAVHPLFGVTLIVTALARIPAQLSRADREVLYALPPYTAATLATVSHRCGAMTRAERDALVREAQLAGYDGELRPWSHRLRDKHRSAWGAD